MMKIGEIKNLIDSKNFKVINAIKCNNYSYDKKKKEMVEIREQMDKRDIIFFFDELDKVISSVNDLTIVVLNEYFFSYHLIVDDENYKMIISRALEITKNKANVILIINICHNVDKDKISKEHISKIKDYSKEIIDNDNNSIWKISSGASSGLFNEERDNYFANETFVIMRGEILYSYKKSTYYYEIDNSSEYNYLIGFGTDEINENLNSELKDIGKMISDKISIEICFDVQNNIKVKKFQNIVIDERNYDFQNFNFINDIRKNINNYDEKKIIVIQSNFTNIYDQISIFPIHSIVIKSDPLQPLVFSVKDKNTIDIIVTNENRCSNFVEKEKKLINGVENHIKRLNQAFEKFKSNFESNNAAKIINEFHTEAIHKSNEKHHFIFYKYDKFSS